MPELPNHWLYKFVTLLVILPPVATMPLFMAAVAGLNPQPSARLVVCALAVLIGLLVFLSLWGSCKDSV